MTGEYESLIHALDQPFSANSPDRQADDGIAAPAREYSFVMKLDRIERAPPAFLQGSDGFSGGKLLHGTLVAQNVFEEAKLRGRGKIAVACPKKWNFRIWIWRKWSGAEDGSEVYCRGHMEETHSRHQKIEISATKIHDCYPTIAYLGILLLLSPIICVMWPAMLFGKIFFPGLILLLIARGALFIWPELLADVNGFDLFLLIYVLFGGTFKFYWWAITLGDDDDSEECGPNDDPAASG